MHKRRLLKLADWLEAQADARKPDFQFNLRMFGRFAKTAAPLTCGTTACALGGAALAGLFKRQGLSFQIDTSYIWRHHDEHNIHVIHTDQNGRRSLNFNAAQKLFGITKQEALHLFCPGEQHTGVTDGKRGARNVAKMIREFVEAGGVR